MKWDDVYGNFKKFADRTAKKINQTADIATLQVKLSMAEKRLNEAFAFLGRAAYEHFSGDSDLSDKVMLAVESVNRIKSEIRSLEEQIEEAKQRAAEFDAQTDVRNNAGCESSECSPDDDASVQMKKRQTDQRGEAVQTAHPSVPVSAFAADSGDTIAVDVMPETGHDPSLL